MASNIGPSLITNSTTRLISRTSCWSVGITTRTRKTVTLEWLEIDLERLNKIKTRYIVLKFSLHILDKNTDQYTCLIDQHYTSRALQVFHPVVAHSMAACLVVVVPKTILIFWFRLTIIRFFRQIGKFQHLKAQFIAESFVCMFNFK